MIISEEKVWLFRAIDLRHTPLLEEFAFNGCNVPKIVWTSLALSVAILDQTSVGLSIAIFVFRYIKG